MMLKMASSVMIITVCSCQFCQPRYFPVILISKRILQASSPTLKRKKNEVQCIDFHSKESVNRRCVFSHGRPEASKNGDNAATNNA
jgi:hypothetical protein